MPERSLSPSWTGCSRNFTLIIDAICKAVLLDLDLVIQCYFEAKDESMLEILARATNFTSDMEQLNRLVRSRN